MRQGGGPNNRRPRSRHHSGGGGHNGGGHSNGGNTPNPSSANSGANRPRSAASLRHQTFDSNSIDVRVRGNAWQVHEKYQALARDAQGSGDRVAAENYLQHAEHYYRIIEAINEATAAEQRTRPGFSGQPDMPANYYADGAAQPNMSSNIDVNANGQQPMTQHPQPGQQPQQQMAQAETQPRMAQNSFFSPEEAEEASGNVAMAANS